MLPACLPACLSALPTLSGCWSTNATTQHQHPHAVPMEAVLVPNVNVTKKTPAALAAQQASQAAEGKRLRRPLQAVREQLGEEE